MYRIAFIFLAIALLNANARALEISETMPTTPDAGLNLNMRASMSFNTTKYEPENAITFEPILRYALNAQNELDFYSTIYRPTSPFRNTELPKTLITFKRNIPWLTDVTTTLRLTGMLQNAAEWKSDGYQTRVMASLEMSKALANRLTGLVRVLPFAAKTEHRTTSDGSEILQYGVIERIGFNYDLNKLQLNAVLLIQQAYGERWSNDFGPEVVLSYQLKDQLAVGAIYQLTNTITDDGLGVYRPLAASNDLRRHRFGVYMEFTF